MEFKPCALPTLIGSLPHTDHRKATRLVLEYTPEIPLWVQLPCHPEERLLSQFAEHLPGIRGEADNIHFDTSDADFQQELLTFFEEYLAVTEGEKALKDSIFAFSETTGKGFKIFLDEVKNLNPHPVALKGQITGPFTMLTGLKDQNGKMAYFDFQLREAVVKAIAMKARYQVEEMKAASKNSIVFMDEPGLSGFGSSAMVSIPREDVQADLTEVIDAIHSAGGICGIHVCANTDWSLVLSTQIDILSFDAYGFFEKILLFKDQLKQFMEKGGVIAWGLVPTLNQEDLQREDVASLKAKWESQVRDLGADPELTKAHALITPSCGTGLLPMDLAIKALRLTRELALAIKA